MSKQQVLVHIKANQWATIHQLRSRLTTLNHPDNMPEFYESILIKYIILYVHQTCASMVVARANSITNVASTSVLAMGDDQKLVKHTNHNI
jgi:hypothetical protein